MKSSTGQSTPGQLGRLILRRLFDKAHAKSRPHVVLPRGCQGPSDNKRTG